MFYDDFRELLAEKHVQIKEVCNYCNINTNTPLYWKKTGSIPKTQVIDKLGEFLGLQLVASTKPNAQGKYLTVVEKLSEEDDAIKMTPVEFELLSKMKKLNLSQLNQLSHFIDFLVYEGKKKDGNV